MLLSGIDYIPWNQDQIIWYQFAKKTCDIPKVSNFYVKKRQLAYVRLHQQIPFTAFNRFCLLSKILPPHSVSNGQNQTGCKNTHSFYTFFYIWKVLIKIYMTERPDLSLLLFTSVLSKIFLFLMTLLNPATLVRAKTW